MNPTRRSLWGLCGCFVLCPLLAGCRPALPPPMPLNQLNAQQRRGYRDFQIYCAQCHDDRDSDSLHGPPLLGVFKQPYFPSGAPANDERLRMTLQEGHGLMPPISMNSQQTRDLLAYLHTL